MEIAALSPPPHSQREGEVYKHLCREEVEVGRGGAAFLQLSVKMLCRRPVDSDVLCWLSNINTKIGNMYEGFRTGLLISLSISVSPTSGGPRKLILGMPPYHELGGICKKIK